jgi:hypothetical protein
MAPDAPKEDVRMLTSHAHSLAYAISYITVEHFYTFCYGFTFYFVEFHNIFFGFLCGLGRVWHRRGPSTQSPVAGHLPNCFIYSSWRFLNVFYIVSNLLNCLGRDVCFDVSFCLPMLLL